MKNKFTPGPWKSCLKELCDGITDAGEPINPHTFKDYYSINAGVGFRDNRDNSSGFELVGYMSEANARLIGAAPDLLYALETLLEDYRDICEDKKTPSVITALEAIAKANGLDKA